MKPQTPVIDVLIARDGPLPDPPEALFQDYTVELFDSEGRACRLQTQANSMADGGAQLRLTFGGDLAGDAGRILREGCRHPDALPSRVRFRIRSPLRDACIPREDRRDAAPAKSFGRFLRQTSLPVLVSTQTRSPWLPRA